MRTTKILYTLTGLLFAGLCTFFSSCSKDEVNIKELYAYAAAGSSAYNLQSGSIALIRSTILSGSGTSFPVLLSRAFEKDVEVTAKIDTSLIRLYDSVYRVTSPRFPAGAFGLAGNGKVTIRAGKDRSEDSLQIALLSATAIPPGTTVYTIPVSLVSASNNIPVSSARQVMFVKLTVASVAAGIRSTDNTASVNVVLQNINGVNTGQDLVYLRSILNQGISKPVTSTVRINTDLVQSYNVTNGTSYQVFPAGSYQLEKATATIAVNTVLSGDSVRIKLTNLAAFAGGTDYLLPVELVEDTALDSPPADATKKVVYILLSVFVNNVDPANATVTGTSISRTGWSVTASGSYAGNAISRVLDGNNATAWDSDGRMPAWVQLDMGTSKTVKGFPIVPSYEYRTDDFVNMEVYSSTNGTVWKLEGKYMGTATSAGSSAASPDIKTVRFISPVTARYFKFNITKTTDGNYAGMAELNAVE